MLAYTALGHSIYMVSAPLIGRLFQPEQVGLFGVFFTIAIFAAGFVCLLYDFAIPAARTHEEARELTVGAVALALLICPLVGLGMALASWLDRFGMGQIPVWACLLMVPILFLQTGIQIAQGWRIRENAPMAIGRANVTLNASRGLLQVGLGIFLPTWWVLAIGELLGRVASLERLVRRRVPKFRMLPSRKRVMATLAQYREFPLVLVPAQFIDGIAVVAQVSGITALFGPAASGQYFLMRRTLDLPIAFIFRSLSDVFYAKLAAFTRDDPERIRPFFTRAFLLLALGGAAVGSPLILFGPEIFHIVYGAGWEEAGALAAVTLPAAIMNLAVAPVSRIFALTTKPNLRFVPALVGLIGTVGVLAASYRFSWDLWLTAAGFSATTSLGYLVYFAVGYVASAHIRTAQNIGHQPIGSPES